MAESLSAVCRKKGFLNGFTKDSRKAYLCAAFPPSKLLLKKKPLDFNFSGNFLLNVANVCELNLKAGSVFDFFISLMRHVAKVQIYVFLNSVGKADQKLKPTYDINGKEL